MNVADVLVVVFIFVFFAAFFIYVLGDLARLAREQLDEVDGGRSAIEFVATARGSAPAAVDDLIGGAA